MVHEVANDDRALPARADIDATMAWRVAGSWGKPQHVIQLKVVVDQQRLTGRDHRLTVKSPDISGRIVPALGRLLPRGVFALMKHVFCLREGRHPVSVAEQSIPATMVNVQVRAKDIIDVLEAQAGCTETVQPGLL